MWRKYDSWYSLSDAKCSPSLYSAIYYDKDYKSGEYFSFVTKTDCPKVT